MLDPEKSKSPRKSPEEVRKDLGRCNDQFEIYALVDSIFRTIEDDNDYCSTVLKLAIERFLELNPVFTRQFALVILNQIRHFNEDTKQ